VYHAALSPAIRGALRLRFGEPSPECAQCRMRLSDAAARLIMRAGSPPLAMDQATMQQAIMQQATLDQNTLDAIVEKMLAPGDFFGDYWAKRPVHIPGAGAACIGTYDVDSVLADVVAARPGPHLVIGVQDGSRIYSHPTTAEDIRAEVEKGGVAPVRLSEFWHRPDIPQNWLWLRALYGALCRSTAMLYMSPTRTENVDLFLAGPTSHLGVHYDTSHTFTLQLFGERKWVIEAKPDLAARITRARMPDFDPDREVALDGETIEVTLHAGDALYVPAYAVHGVSSTGWSISIGLGLRAYNEVDFLSHILESLESARYIDYPPVETYPEQAGERHEQAKMELLRKVRHLLKQLEMTAVGALTAPLRLPDTLGPIDPSQRAAE
jgi:ribosomal protein L16 Arg81 hydroxylase